MITREKKSSPCCAALLSIFLLVSGCSWFDSGAPEHAAFEPFQSPAAHAEVKSQENAPPATASETAVQPKSPKPELPQYIEVTWEIPADKVEGYVIRYGTDKDNLESVVRLAPGDVQKTRHPKYGEVFRYLLPNPPRDKTVYVSVAAVSAGNESAPSSVFEVAPDPKALPKPAPPAAPATESSEPAAPKSE